MSVSQTNTSRFLTEDAFAGCRIIPVPPARQQEAIVRLVGDGSPAEQTQAERFLAFAAANRISLKHLWSMVDSRDQVLGTVLVVPNPGKTAMVFCTHARTQAEVQPFARLIDHAAAELDPSSVHLLQVLLEPGEVLEREVLVACGFEQLALLSYMERPIQTLRKVAPPRWPDGTRVVAYDESLREELLSVLDASYEGTLDCPGLRGLRLTHDILEGHRSTGSFNPDLWTLLRVDDRPAGAILLNPSPTHKTIELVYIGLAPFARGQGLGTQLLRHGLHLLRGRREQSITLAVDDRNAPAASLYRREGFRRALRRVAMIRSLAVKR